MEEPQNECLFRCFRDRIQASELIADRLASYQGEHPLVLGIPRGAMPMAQLIADRLEGDLDVVLVHKIGAPDNPEFAIGSVSEFGTLYRSRALDRYRISSEYFIRSATEEISKLKERRRAYSPVGPATRSNGRIVILIDDGIATGSTLLAAVRAIRSQNPHQLIVATPVASLEAAHAVEREADLFVALETPEEFLSISEFYNDFPQVSDREVIQILSEARLKELHQNSSLTRTTRKVA